MLVKETQRPSEEMGVKDIIGLQDPNIRQYLNDPENPLWVTPLSITDADGAALAVVRNDPSYGTPCHLVRVEDGRYASVLPGAVTGDIFEREVSGENRLCLDL